MNLRFTVIFGVDLLVLLRTRPQLATLRALGRHPSAWLAAHGNDAAITAGAESLLWVIAAWLAVGLVAAALAALPGAAGQAAAALARLVLPRAALKLVCGAAGLGIALGPTSAFADTGHLPAPLPPTSSAAHLLQSPVWPTSEPLPPTEPPPTAGRTAPPPVRAVLVKPGDSLWSIARTQLSPDATDAQVAAAWPAWYRANRAEIGRDPALLRAGERLQPPTNDAAAVSGGAQ